MRTGWVGGICNILPVQPVYNSLRCSMKIWSSNQAYPIVMVMPGLKLTCIDCTRKHQQAPTVHEHISKLQLYTTTSVSFNSTQQHQQASTVRNIIIKRRLYTTSTTKHSKKRPYELYPSTLDIEWVRAWSCEAGHRSNHNVEWLLQISTRDDTHDKTSTKSLLFADWQPFDLTQQNMFRESNFPGKKLSDEET